MILKKAINKKEIQGGMQMKKIILKSLKLTNFKGAKDVTIKFNDNINSVYGANKAGKTTIFDAFTWVMFGKDSLGKKDFDIKTRDEAGNIIPKIEHEVEARIGVNEREIVLKSVFREKWVTKRGELEPEFKGHETIYYFDDVPMKQEEYKKKISEVIDEKIFKLTTNPRSFEDLKWQDKRKILFHMVSEQEDCEFAKSRTEFEKLAEILETKTADEIKKEIAAKKKKIKAEIETVPARIDEVTRGMPEGEDWAELEENINEKKALINSLRKQINEAETPSENNLRVKKKINELEGKMTEFNNKIYAEYKDKRNIILQSISETENNISELEIKAESGGRKILDIKKELSESKKLIENLREKIKALNNKIFDESSTICPVCGRAYESDKIDEMKRHFEESKISEFNNFNERGKNIKKGMTILEASLSKIIEDKENYEKNIKELKELLVQKQNELNSVDRPVLSEYDEYSKMAEEKEKLCLMLDKPADTSGLNNEINNIEKEIEELNKRLLKKERINKDKKRIKELEEKHRELAEKSAALDKKEFEIQSFIKAKIEKLENQINSKFKLVKFKLFETQINGAEAECCEITSGGIPFHDLNNEMKLNTGLDIINVLCENYEVSTPIFIDNREGVTEIIETESQLINLIVSADDKKLRVEDDDYGK